MRQNQGIGVIGFTFGKMPGKPTTAYSHKKPGLLLTTLRLTFLSAKALPYLGGYLALKCYLTPNLGFRKPRPFPLLDQATERWTLLIHGKRVQAFRWGQGPSVLLVHGWESSSSRFAPMIQALTGAGFSAVAMDAPGHGLSGGRSTNILEMTDLIHDLADKTGGFYALVGHSFGGAAALFAAAHGVTAERLITLNTPATFTGLFDKFCLTLRIESRVKISFRHQLDAMFHRHGRDIWIDFSAEENMKQMNRPVLVIHDQDDAVIPYLEGDMLARAGKEAEFWQTQGFGHNGILSQTAVLARCLEFLQSGNLPGNTGN